MRSIVMNIWKIPCLLLALAIVGCSEDDDTYVEPPDEVPSPDFSIGSGTDSSAHEFEVIGNPTVDGSVYTFNADGETKNECDRPGGDYIQLDTLEAIWENGFSVAAWVEFQENRYYERIIDFGNGWGENGGMNITFSRRGSANDLAFTSWIDSDSLVNREKGRLVAWDAIVNNENMLYVGTISPSGEMKIYVNGELVAEKADGHPVANVQRNKNYIGHSNWCTVDADFKGVMRGVYIYNEPITAGQVKALYEAGSEGTSGTEDITGSEGS